jgi:hypothetical protein
MDENPDKSAGIFAVVAGLIAAVKFWHESSLTS